MDGRREGANKTETAYRLLRRDILAARLMPGAPLKVNALRNAYGVGWTPLREALSRLEAERLVTAISNRGFAVAPVSRDELQDLTEARRVIELPLLLESIEQGDSEWEAAVVTAHYRLSRCKTAAEDPSDEAIDAWDERHEEFHAALLSAAKSSWLKRFRTTIADQLRRHHRVLSLTPTLRAAAAGRRSGFEQALSALQEAQSIEAHTALMEAALDRDLDRATALMTEHITHTVNVYDVTEDGAGAGQSASRNTPARPAAE
jgi:GntR family carbon starvation induced transcriptional regulator